MFSEIYTTITSSCDDNSHSQRVSYSQINIEKDREKFKVINKSHFYKTHDQPQLYEIRLKGHLESQWEDWFAGMSITLEDNGTTLLHGPVADQAALHGLLKRIRDLGMPLISISPTEPNLSNESNIKKQE